MYNMLSGSLQLFNTQSGSLLLVLPANSTCRLHAPYFPLLLSIPWRRQLLLPSLYVRREASGKQVPSLPLSITFNHLNASSAFCSFHLPPLLFLPSPAFFFTLAISQLLTTASLITVLHLSISMSFQLFSSPTILPLVDASSSYISSLPQRFCPRGRCTICTVQGWKRSNLKVFLNHTQHQ